MLLLKEWIYLPGSKDKKSGGKPKIIAYFPVDNKDFFEWDI